MLYALFRLEHTFFNVNIAIITAFCSKANEFKSAAPALNDIGRNVEQQGCLRIRSHNHQIVVTGDQTAGQRINHALQHVVSAQDVTGDATVHIRTIHNVHNIILSECLSLRRNPCQIANRWTLRRGFETKVNTAFA